MEYNWEEPGKSKKSTIWSHFDEEKKHQKAKCGRSKNFSRPDYILRSLLFLSLAQLRIAKILQDHIVLGLVSPFFLLY